LSRNAEGPIPPDPTILVIFGASGDLTQRKIVPAIYNLFLDGWLPEPCAIIGLARTAMSDKGFRTLLRRGIGQFSRQGPPQDEDWRRFGPLLRYMTIQYDDPGAYSTLADCLAELANSWKAAANCIFYLATPPSEFEVITQCLGQAKLSRDRKRARIVVEKPFGRNLLSARKLDQTLTSVFDESQVYRIDHYLGKETVQNILAFRFANVLFEPIWNRRYIDHVQITVAEQVGLESRGGYYDQSGALRDMVQNHLLQLMCLIAMEPPTSFQSDEIRNKKVDVLRAARPIPRQQVHHFAVRGQYGPGAIQGKRLPGYRQEQGVTTDSPTETFAALRLFVDNWRWQGVPFYLRTGKRLPARVSEVSIQFRPVPHQAFPSTAIEDWQPNRLIINIQPQEDILLRCQAKQPGPTMHLRPIDLRFSYQEAFRRASPEAYETLLLDVMRGDATLFMRADQVETAWSVISPILEAWTSVPLANFPNYAAGTWGPDSAETLIARDGRNWFLPTLSQSEPR
jgi:glucose-6-phosphate 1-dehydrogenase